MLLLSAADVIGTVLCVVALYPVVYLHKAISVTGRGGL
jgi:hypothetical protein